VAVEMDELLSQIRECIAKKQKWQTDKDHAFLEAWDGNEQNKRESLNVCCDCPEQI
jgi:hypothetical protein